jgi:hypothetical protein
MSLTWTSCLDWPLCLSQPAVCGWSGCHYLNSSTACMFPLMHPHSGQKIRTPRLMRMPRKWLWTNHEFVVKGGMTNTVFKPHALTNIKGYTLREGEIFYQGNLHTGFRWNDILPCKSNQTLRDTKYLLKWKVTKHDHSPLPIQVDVETANSTPCECYLISHQYTADSATVLCKRY